MKSKSLTILLAFILIFAFNVAPAYDVGSRASPQIEKFVSVKSDIQKTVGVEIPAVIVHQNFISLPNLSRAQVIGHGELIMKSASTSTYLSNAKDIIYSPLITHQAKYIIISTKQPVQAGIPKSVVRYTFGYSMAN